MRILVATDGSSYGYRAVEYVRDLIDGNTSHEVKVISVVEPAAGTELETLIESVEELADPSNPAEQRAENIVEDAADILKRDSNRTVSVKVIAGPVARSIVEEAESWKADLIVVGNHGLGFWEKALVGSVSDRVASHARCSVLIVR